MLEFILEIFIAFFEYLMSKLKPQSPEKEDEKIKKWSR